MALRGSLQDLSIPELLHLLNISRKSGVLVITHADDRGYICFREGEVFFARHDEESRPLGKRLVQAAILTQADVDHALASQRRAGHQERLGKILLRQGSITRGQLQHFITEQIKDCIFRIFLWRDGWFEFQAGTEIFADEDIGIQVPLEELVAEGLRRRQEWDEIALIIPDPGVVLKMHALGAVERASISLSGEEWAILAFVDGNRTAGEIVELSGFGELKALGLLKVLMGTGLLEQVEGSSEAGNEPSRQEERPASSQGP
ncbi:MAG: DUF4388 domain-containing protein, partial [Candidatus Geothermincolia bacterium]